MAEAKSKCHCCVPHCQANKQRQPYLSFHGFPSDIIERKKWVQAIRRDEGPDFTILRGSTFVCSRHFNQVDFTPATDRKRLKVGIVPSRFQWNNWGESQQESVYDRATTGLGHDVHRCEDASPGSIDHNYAAGPAPGVLETEPPQLTVSHLHFHGFCVSDENIHFYTRFASKEVFHAFWETVQPSASMLVYWSQAQKKGQIFAPTFPSPMRRLRLIDEFFLYCCRVAAGLKETVLADIFQVSVSTVCSIVITWANYLYLLFSSLPIWMSRRQVESTMPLKFRQYSPEVRVIISCTKVWCEIPSSLSLQSEEFSIYKNITTLKGLIGIAPCGAVTFVSSLYAGSISDRELTERCGILDLLEPGDGCVADRGFTIEKMLANRGAKLIIPPFKTTAQFSKKGALKRQAIARLRIRVKRTIRRVKEYHIWDTTLPLSLSGTVNQLWTNCCLMTNFQGPLDLNLT
ncbi:uncharacterized protein [Thunnus thynnus]|uniref:uncharacterized protein n=1 Tax=Thunnus thynnus TaxID=8237 RepID=UPI0035278708